MAGPMMRKVYVGMSRLNFADEDVKYGPADTAAAVQLPDDATVVGWRLINGSEYVVWVCDV